MADDPAKDQAMKDYEARKQALNEANVKSAAKGAASMPTPTQEECDMIKLGILDPSQPKKDDGSGPEMVRVVEFRERDMAPSGAGTYETRTAASGETPEQKAERERREAREKEQAARRERR